MFEGFGGRNTRMIYKIPGGQKNNNQNRGQLRTVKPSNDVCPLSNYVIPKGNSDRRILLDEKGRQIVVFGHRLTERLLKGGFKPPTLIKDEPFDIVKYLRSQMAEVMKLPNIQAEDRMAVLLQLSYQLGINNLLSNTYPRIR